MRTEQITKTFSRWIGKGLQLNSPSGLCIKQPLAGTAGWGVSFWIKFNSFSSTTNNAIVNGEWTRLFTGPDGTLYLDDYNTFRDGTEAGGGRILPPFDSGSNKLLVDTLYSITIVDSKVYVNGAVWINRGASIYFNNFNSNGLCIGCWGTWLTMWRGTPDTLNAIIYDIAITLFEIPYSCALYIYNNYKGCMLHKSPLFRKTGSFGYNIILSYWRFEPAYFVDASVAGATYPYGAFRAIRSLVGGDGQYLGLSGITLPPTLTYKNRTGAIAD